MSNQASAAAAVALNATNAIVHALAIRGFLTGK
jgi:hypothetical protein